MLEQARARLGDHAAYVVADLRDPLPGAPYCAVVSALAIHHLEDDDKRALYGRVLEALKPGGVFVNAEQVAGATPEQDAEFLEWHRVQAAALGTTEEEWAAALQRFTHDRCATTATQLRWLRELGYEDVAAPIDDRRFAVFSGRRPR